MARPRLADDTITANGHYMRAYRARKPRSAQSKETQQRWRAANREHVQEYGREYRRRQHVNWNRGRHYRAMYGLTIEEYEAKLKQQDYKCQICSDPILHSRGKSGRALDHNHKTGAIRGFLCSRCNVGIGHFLDSITRMQSAIDYL